MLLTLCIQFLVNFIFYWRQCALRIVIWSWYRNRICRGNVIFSFTKAEMHFFIQRWDKPPKNIFIFKLSRQGNKSLKANRASPIISSQLFAGGNLCFLLLNQRSENLFNHYLKIFLCKKSKKKDEIASFSYLSYYSPPW